MGLRLRSKACMVWELGFKTSLGLCLCHVVVNNLAAHWTCLIYTSRTSTLLYSGAPVCAHALDSNLETNSSLQILQADSDDSPNIDLQERLALDTRLMARKKP